LCNIIPIILNGRKEDIMPTKKNTENTEVSSLRRRVSELNDRIAVLENSLKRTQDLIQADIKSLYSTMQKR